ncbi:MAG: orotidine 5'-phosphate decarboxylase [Methanomicrobiales archaeon]|nr:orotidine 5'-phosphate decarboxylase [Methanomicrobiales archaeon]
MGAPVLQIALDLLETSRAVQIAQEAVAGGADWLEAGTPLIKSEGMAAVRALREAFPGRVIVADMKIADTGALELEMAARSGASVVTVLADADDAVITEALLSARRYGVKVMADLLTANDPVARARHLAGMGVDFIVAHVGIDRQMRGDDPLSLLQVLSGELKVPIAAAGGLDAMGASESVRYGAEVVIVGGAITRAADVTAATRLVREAIDKPGGTVSSPGNRGEEVRSIFLSVSTPNISDAMHREGAMSGIVPLCGDLRMAGTAVTVRSLPGDWAKAVEAIDLAGPGDVVVIDNGGVTDVATWGELATISCFNRQIAGVVIDGAARDIEDIRALGLPVFARAVVPNAGDPKGFGEINTEVRCGGRSVRPGDWVVGDASGVVVIPRERAYEVARRAREVRRQENRIREEISRGSTLSEVAALLKWEKK